MTYRLAALRSETDCWAMKIASCVIKDVFLVTSRKSVAVQSILASSSLVLICEIFMTWICSSNMLVIFVLAAVELIEPTLEADDLARDGAGRDGAGRSRRGWCCLEADLERDSPGELQAACLLGCLGG